MKDIRTRSSVKKVSQERINKQNPLTSICSCGQTQPSPLGTLSGTTRNILQHLHSIYPAISTPAPSYGLRAAQDLNFTIWKVDVQKREIGILEIKNCHCGLKRFPRNLANCMMSSDNRGRKSFNDWKLIIRISALPRSWAIIFGHWTSVESPAPVSHPVTQWSLFLRSFLLLNAWPFQGPQILWLAAYFQLLLEA